VDIVPADLAAGLELLALLGYDKPIRPACLPRRAVTPGFDRLTLTKRSRINPAGFTGPFSSRHERSLHISLGGLEALVATFSGAGVLTLRRGFQPVGQANDLVQKSAFLGAP
jgi:hypothetical protein